MARPIRVLVIGSSVMPRKMLVEGLSQDPGIEVIGVAVSLRQACDKIEQLKPDVITLDINLPRLQAARFFREYVLRYLMPIIVVSSLSEKEVKLTLDALEAGAFDFVVVSSKSAVRDPKSWLKNLRGKINTAVSANIACGKNAKTNLQRPEVLPNRLYKATREKVIVIGAATGGPEAIRSVLEGFPATTPGVVIVLHMPGQFTRAFAERLNQTATMTVKEAESGERIIAGRVLIAPGGKQMRVFHRDGQYRVYITTESRLDGNAHVVDIMMNSIAEHVGGKAVGVILTGGGQDGACALKLMRDKGARCIAQDRASSMVFDMPRAAYACGGAERLISLPKISSAVLELVTSKR